jgi:hypothetical protein
MQHFLDGGFTVAAGKRNHAGIALSTPVICQLRHRLLAIGYFDLRDITMLPLFDQCYNGTALVGLINKAMAIEINTLNGNKQFTVTGFSTVDRDPGKHSIRQPLSTDPEVFSQRC